MKKSKNGRLIPFILFFYFLFSSPISFAATADQSIASLLQKAPQNNLTQRIRYFSAAFLNAPYQLEPLGEGNAGEFNQGPLYRLDVFDCQTFIETVLALSLAQDPAAFKRLIIEIRYAHGLKTFADRNHFVSADWLPNNHSKGFIYDVTTQVAGARNSAIMTTYINRRKWYRHLTVARIKIPDLTPAESQIKLAELKRSGKNAANTWTSIRYIPKKTLFADGAPQAALFDRIPDGAIILIIARSAPIAIIGTDIDVSHMGFAIWHGGQLYFREASSVQGKVADIKLSDYLSAEPNIRGISVWRVI